MVSHRSHQQPMAKKHVTFFNEVMGLSSWCSWENRILWLTSLTAQTCLEAHSLLSQTIVSFRPSLGKLMNVMFCFFVSEAYCKCLYILFLNDVFHFIVLSSLALDLFIVIWIDNCFSAMKLEIFKVLLEYVYFGIRLEKWETESSRMSVI